MLEQDLLPDSTLVAAINGYLSNPPAGADPNEVIGTLLEQVKVPEEQERPKWAEQVGQWSSRFSKEPARAKENPEDSNSG